MRIKEYQADLMLLSVTFFWGSTFFVVQDALDFIGVYLFLFFRFGLATLIMLPIAYKSLRTAKTQSIYQALLLGALLFLGFAFQTFGLVYSPSSIVAFVTGLNVIAVPILLVLFFKNQVRLIVALAAGIAMLGLYLLTMSGNLSFGYGEFLTLLAAIFIALHIIATDKLSKIHDTNILVLFQFISVSLIALGGALVFEDITFSKRWLEQEVVLALVITAVFATVYAYIVQTKMQKFTTPTKTAIIFTAEPVFALLFGFVLGGETFTQLQLIGCALIIGSMLIAEIKPKP